jgi:thiol:disulfide interchange protein DsbC
MIRTIVGTMPQLAAALLLVLAGASQAQQATPPASPPTNPPSSAPTAAPASLEDEIRARVEKVLNAKPDSVVRTPFGLWEVVIGREVFYVDTAVNYLIAGRVIDTRTREDLTATKRDELLRVDFKSLPLNQAFKIVRGNGSRVLVTFEDPNCGYCKKLYRDLATLDNVTIHTFLFPILSQDSFEKSRGIWCAKDRVAAWDDWMAKNKAPPTAAADCKHPLQQVLALGQSLEITATPTMVFADGRRVPGAVGIDRVEAMLKEVAAAAKASAKK